MSFKYRFHLDGWDYACVWNQHVRVDEWIEVVW